MNVVWCLWELFSSFSTTCIVIAIWHKLKIIFLRFFASTLYLMHILGLLAYSQKLSPLHSSVVQFAWLLLRVCCRLKLTWRLSTLPECRCVSFRSFQKYCVHLERFEFILRNIYEILSRKASHDQSSYLATSEQNWEDKRQLWILFIDEN